MGVTIGAITQEVTYLADGLWGGENVSLTEDIIHQIKGGGVLEGAGAHHLSALAYAEHYLRGGGCLVDERLEGGHLGGDGDSREGGGTITLKAVTV